MFIVPRSTNGNPPEGDEAEHGEFAKGRFVHFCRLGFATLFLGSLFVSGICWFVGIPGFPVWPWNQWFIFRGEYPFGTDARVYLVQENGEEQKVDMDQWFQYEVSPGWKRYSDMYWDTDHAMNLGRFVAGKNLQAPIVQGPVKSVILVHRWWPITRGRRPTEADRAKGDMHIYKVAIDKKGN